MVRINTFLKSILFINALSNRKDIPQEEFLSLYKQGFLDFLYNTLT